MPFLLLFVFRFKKAIKKATKEVRKNQSEIVTVAEQGLESERVVKAFGTQTLEETRLHDVSAATVQSALKARKVKSLLSPVVSIMTAGCVALVLWRGAGLILAGAMTAGVLTIFLSYLNKFFKPVQDLAKMTTTIAQTAVGVERIRAILDADDMIPERSDAYRAEGTCAATSSSITWSSATARKTRCCAMSISSSERARWWASWVRREAANRRW